LRFNIIIGGAMKKNILFFAILAGLLVAASPSSAQTNTENLKEIIRDAVEVDRKAYITERVILSEDESKAFWPVYNEYRDNVRTITVRLDDLILKYSDQYWDLTDETIKELMVEFMDLEDDLVSYKREYVKDLLKVLPAKKSAALFQLENKLSAAIRYELADRIPLVNEGELGLKENLQNNK
jgi:hypothetical protein